MSDPSVNAAGQPSEDLAAEIAYGGGRSENIQVPATLTAWQPDPRTIEWVAKQLEWELKREDTRGPATFASAIPAWLRRVKKDKKRLREAR